MINIIHNNCDRINNQLKSLLSLIYEFSFILFILLEIQFLSVLLMFVTPASTPLIYTVTIIIQIVKHTIYNIFEASKSEENEEE